MLWEDTGFGRDSVPDLITVFDCSEAASGPPHHPPAPPRPVLHLATRFAVVCFAIGGVTEPINDLLAGLPSSDE
ncbi:hypothetical protein EVAR_62382_1 [Eumeta japonica]|uniref:Uncharacterized protein n=1 Tax=Eumeta variegata TaxID=151549 RepID=A0A4C1Z0W5_EUMVA|nr:hypothetical protein EVAR_62382_1 [Eumeta japonica]